MHQYFTFIVEGELEGLTVNFTDDNTEDDIVVDTNIDMIQMKEYPEVSKNEADKDEARTDSLERKNEGLEREVEDTDDINTVTILKSEVEETITKLDYEVAKLKGELSKEKSKAEVAMNVMQYEVSKLKEELSKEKSDAEETINTLKKEKTDAKLAEERAEAEKIKAVERTAEYKRKVEAVENEVAKLKLELSKNALP